MAKCGCGNQVATTGNKLPAGARVFVLSGASRQGKSTTLNKLADYVASQSGWSHVAGPNPPVVGSPDHKYVFENKRRSIKVGISTAGDGAKQIKDGFSYFRANNCHVCFIASKTSGIAIRHIEQECFNDNIVPQYQFLHGEYSPNWRNQIKVQADVVEQLFSLI